MSLGAHSYAYGGEGGRVSQTVSSVVTRYLCDVHPRLAQVIAATNIERYLHGPRGFLSLANGHSRHSLKVRTLTVIECPLPISR